MAEYLKNKRISDERKALIGGRDFHLSDGEEDIFYKNQWYTVHFDQDGDFYFFYQGKTMYFRPVNKETFVRH